QREASRHDPDQHGRTAGWRPLGPRLRGRRHFQRQPRCPVLHRRDQRRGKRAVRCHSRSQRKTSKRLGERRWSRQPLYADLMEWGTAGLHGSEQMADINRNARPTSSALWVRIDSFLATWSPRVLSILRIIVGLLFLERG